MEKIKCTTCGKDNFSNSKYCSNCGYELPKISIENLEDKVLKTSTQKNDKWKKIMNNKVIAVIVFVISWFVFRQFFSGPPSFDKAMMMIASELNKTCPIMISKDLRLDNSIALPDNTFQYNYTFINADKSEINADTAIKYTEPNLINNIKTNEDLKLFRDNKTTLVYNYRDKKGVFVFKLTVTPDKYK